MQSTQFNVPLTNLIDLDILDCHEDEYLNAINSLTSAGVIGSNAVLSPTARDIILNTCKTTTISDFEHLCAKNPKYKITDAGHYGQTIVSKVASLGHITLMQHILDKNVNCGVNLCDGAGCTALWNAIYYFAKKRLDNKTVCQAVKMLIEHGANPNLAPHCELRFDEPDADLPALSTALWLAAEKTNSLSLIQLLLINRACIYTPLTSQAQARVNQALQQLFDAFKHLKQVNLNASCQLPKELITLICNKFLFQVICT